MGAVILNAVEYGIRCGFQGAPILDLTVDVSLGHLGRLQLNLCWPMWCHASPRPKGEYSPRRAQKYLGGIFCQRNALLCV